MAQSTAAKQPHIRFTDALLRPVRWLIAFSASIQTASPRKVFGWIEVGIALALALFPAQRVILAAADGRVNGLIFNQFISLMFAGCGFVLLFKQRISDDEMKVLLSPLFLLSLLCGYLSLNTLINRPEALSGILIFTIIVIGLFILGTSYTFSAFRERPE